MITMKKACTGFGSFEIGPVGIVVKVVGAASRGVVGAGAQHAAFQGPGACGGGRAQLRPHVLYIMLC